MKKIYCGLSLILLTSVVSAQLPVNLGFENWTKNSKGWLDPNGWGSSNMYYVVSNISVERITGRTGGYALRLNKISDPTSPIGVSGGYIEYLSPVVSYKSILLKGYWMGNFNSGNDSIRVSVVYYDANNSYVTTKYKSTGSTPSLPSWTPFSTTIDGNNGANWSYILSLEYITTDNVHPDSLRAYYGAFDDLTMDVLTSTGEEMTIDLMRTFNLLTKEPFKEYAIKMDLLKPSNVSIQLIDAQGKIIESSQKQYSTGIYEYPLNLSGVADGIYFCKIQSEKSSQTFKLVKGNN